jgi:hypothetical protein
MSACEEIIRYDLTNPVNSPILVKIPGRLSGQSDRVKLASPPLSQLKIERAKRNSCTYCVDFHWSCCWMGGWKSSPGQKLWFGDGFHHGRWRSSGRGLPNECWGHPRVPRSLSLHSLSDGMCCAHEPRFDGEWKTDLRSRALFILEVSDQIADGQSLLNCSRSRQSFEEVKQSLLAACQ